MQHPFHPESMQKIHLASPLSWLVLGAADLLKNPLPGLLHGLAVTLFAGLLLGLAGDQFWWLAGAFSGFLMVAPVVATGLYAVSRAAEQGQRILFRDIWRIWRSGDKRLMGFGLLLGAAGTGWVLTSAGLITLWSVQPVREPLDFLKHVVLAPSPGLFEVWLLLGALLAAPVFASSVTTLPMLVDTKMPLWAAIGESWRAVGSYPVVLGFWALLIVVLVFLGLMTFLLGLIVVIPWLGHSSWHAYQALKGAGAVNVWTQ